MTRAERHRAATLLEERADLLWIKYKTYRYGQAWDTTQAQ